MHSNTSMHVQKGYVMCTKMHKSRPNRARRTFQGLGEGGGRNVLGLGFVWHVWGSDPILEGCF